MSRLADAPLKRHLPDHLVRLALVRGAVVERLPLHEARRVREQMPNGYAVEMDTAKVREVVIYRRIDVDASVAHEPHDGHRRRHHLRHGREVELRRGAHRPWLWQSATLEVVELSPAERSFVDHPAVLRDDEHGAGNRVLDGGRDDGVRGRQPTRKTVAARRRRLAGSDAAEEQNAEE